jgi:hypothetical protein
MITIRQAGRLGGLLILFLTSPGGRAADGPVPPFGRDTVLVWKTISPPEAGNLVVRIAEFRPDLYLEWENTVTQGTIFMPARSVESARVFLNSRLFEGGVDTRGREATTLWLSHRIYDGLKAKGRMRFAIDSVDGWMSVEGTEKLRVDVNRTPTEIPVIKTKDDRGAERWFIDDPGNPLMVRHLVRTYESVLASITTDRPNTLRWIKGRKLANPPR